MRGGEAFRGLASDGKNGGCDPISTRRHSVPNPTFHVRVKKGRIP